MNWNDLRYFLVLAEENSLSGAARRLRKEHTTVARRIEALEGDLGTKLFDRLPRGWQLTSAGRNLVPVAERVEEEALTFERQAKGDEAAHGVVRISVPRTFELPRPDHLNYPSPKIGKSMADFSIAIPITFFT